MLQHDIHLPLGFPTHRRRAFILFEVLISLAIMGVTLAMILQSFTTSMRASQRSQRMTTATLLAREMMDKWELVPPEFGETEGDFDERHPGFTYVVDYEQERLEYDNVSSIEEGRLAYLRLVTLEIFYQSKRMAEPKRYLHIESALTSSERFSDSARLDNEIGFEI
jgi:Tfp pilus assembly protein PilE